MSRELIEHGDIVYVLDEVKVNRGIRGKNKKQVNELLIFGFNKRLNKELYLKIKNEIKKERGK